MYNSRIRLDVQILEVTINVREWKKSVSGSLIQIYVVTFLSFMAEKTAVCITDYALHLS